MGLWDEFTSMFSPAHSAGQSVTGANNVYAYRRDATAKKNGYANEDEYRAAMAAKYQGLAPETVGSLADSNYNVFTQSPVNKTQTPIERLYESRQNFYYGGTRNAANAAAENAQTTGNAYANTLTQNANNLNARGEQVFNRQYGAEGPSGAQAMLRQGTNEALGTQLALARSGRGMGESASGLGAAGRNAVTLQAGAANNAALLKAQESEAYAQRRDAAQRANDQAALGYSTLGQEGYGAAGGMAFQGQGLANQIQGTALNANEGYEGNLLQQYGIEQGVNAQNQARKDAQNAAYMQLAANGLTSAATAYGKGSDERMKKDIYKLSPREAKKGRQELSSSGAFADPLATPDAPAPWLDRYMAGGGTPNGMFPTIGAPSAAAPAPGTLAPARTTMISPNYQPPKSSFAQSLDADPNRGNPEAHGIVNPWAAQEARASMDPWQRYLMDRDRKEQERHDKEDEDAKTSQVAGALAGLAMAGIGFGGLMSDERGKKRKLPLGRRAQDPIRDMPAISGRGVIMSDEHSKKKISDLKDENGKLKDALGTTSSMGSAAALKQQAQAQQQAAPAFYRPFPAAPAAKAPAPSPEDIARWYGGSPAAAPAAAPSPAMTPREAIFYGGQSMAPVANAMDTGNETFPTAQLMRSSNAYQADLAEGAPIPRERQPWYPDNAEVTVSDRNSKMEIESLRAQVEALGGTQQPDPYEQRALQAIKAAPGFSYQYKQPGAPGAAAGTHYGPMAQDLEKTPMGASTVIQAPNGTKMVDTGRLSLVNTAALHAQQQELDDLQRKLDELRSSATPATPEAPEAKKARLHGKQGLAAGAWLSDKDAAAMKFLRRRMDDEGTNQYSTPEVQRTFMNKVSPAEAERLQRLANSTWM